MRGISLRLKTIFGVVVIAVLLAFTAVFISYQVYSNTMDEHYRSNAANIAATAAGQMDGDRIADYIRQVQALDPAAADYAARVQAIKDGAYQKMLDTLFEIKDNMQVLYLYVEYLSPDGQVMYVIDADTPGEACELGEIYPLAAQNYQYLDKLEQGLPAFITNTEDFGWLCSAGAPILTGDGQVAAIVGVDISMDAIMADRQQFLRMVSLILLGITVLLIGVILLLINRALIRPINQLASAAASFVSDQDNRQDTAISLLHIHTGDEIEHLSLSIKTMEREINEYIHNLTAVTAEKERIGTELNVATKIQASMLPCIFPAFPDRPELDIYATMNPAKEVGGDFYDFFLTDENHLALVMADVSGKGVPAALFMVIAKTLIKNHAQTGQGPAEVFTNVNRQLCENNEAGMFVTAWMGLLDLRTGALSYANAGHNKPLVKKKDGAYQWLETRPGFVLAGMEDIRYRQAELTLEKGDRIYLYTDGVTEALNPALELFSDPRLQEVLNSQGMQGVSVEVLLRKMKEEIDLFAQGAEQADDITMLALEYRGNGEVAQ